MSERTWQHLTQSHAPAVAVFALLVLVSGYGFYQLTSLRGQVAELNAELASTTARLEGTINTATTTFASAIENERRTVASKLGGFQDQVGSISGTVTSLQKLSATDPELLAKYSKVFFLSDTYAPARLVEIPTQYRYAEKEPLQIIPEVLPHLTEMIDQATADKVTLYVDSGYRSFTTQQALKGQYRVTYGAGTANQFSADQGYSEHQLGTTIDMITTGTGGGLEGFDKTEAYAWLEDNAYRYGFVLSYPKNNGYYVFEPWHWRFVGVKLAADLHKKGDYFYQMDQRAIDEYLISLFD